MKNEEIKNYFVTGWVTVRIPVYFELNEEEPLSYEEACEITDSRIRELEEGDMDIHGIEYVDHDVDVVEDTGEPVELYIKDNL